MALRSQWFSRDRSGAVRLQLRADEAAFLTQVIGELREALAQPADSPLMQRLFPRAYLDPTEDAAEREYSILVNADLLRVRLDRTQAILDVLEPIALRPSTAKAVSVVLTGEQVGEWMGAVNDARLALGVVFDADEDLDIDDLDPQDPRRYGLEVYDLLSYFFSELVDVAALSMPSEGLE